MKNDPLAIVERLAARANGEAAANVDVADNVLARLRSREVATVSFEREYVWIGASSVLAACAASLIFWLGTVNDSLWTLVQPFIMVLQ